MRHVSFVPAVLLMAAACMNPAGDSAAAKAAIDAKNANWARLTAAGHADSLVQFYHANAVMYPPNMGAVRGLDSIRGFFAVINTMSSPPPTLSVTADSVWASASGAVELGRWTFVWPATGRPAGTAGAPAVDSGRYIVRWVNEGGQWLMVQDIWNSAMPAPQGGP
jgi:ketosteroid isomerase-like protein